MSSAGNLNVTAGGTITQSAALTVGGTTSLNAGAHAITLTQTGNSFTGSVALTTTGSNSASLTNSLATTLAASSIGRNLMLTSVGAISQTGSLSVGNRSTFNAGANAISLGAANAFTGAVSFMNTGAGQFRDPEQRQQCAGVRRRVDRRQSDGVVGHLDADRDHVLTVGGTSGSTTGGNDLTLTQANALTGTVTVPNGGNVSVTNASPLSLSSASHASGSLTLTADSLTPTGPGITVGTGLSIAPNSALTVDYGGGGVASFEVTPTLLANFSGYTSLTVGSGIVRRADGPYRIVADPRPAADPGVGQHRDHGRYADHGHQQPDHQCRQQRDRRCRDDDFGNAVGDGFRQRVGDQCGE